MNSLSILSQMKQSSPLGVQSHLKPEGEKAKKNLAADLLLTALIDAFSILVIFLLMTFSTSGEFMMGKDIELPKAASGELMERFPMVRLQDEKIYLEDKMVTVDSLVGSLLELRKNYAKTNPGVEYPGIITVQADRRMNYESLNPIVLALSHAGFGEIRFAVLAQ